MDNQQIESWMFREKYEFLYLFFSISLLLATGYVLANINIYIVLFAIIVGFIYIKLQQAQLIGNSLEINDKQFPEVHKSFELYKNKLNLNNVKLYVIQDPNPNAYTIGFPSASIILHSSLVENLTLEELHFVIAHELGHVKASHNIILTFIYPLGNGIMGSSLIFGLWRRKAEYTSDKCGLILTKNIDSAIVSLLKLSIGLKLTKEIDLTNYKKQLIDSNNKMVILSEFLFDHPLTTNRVKKIVNFWKKNFISN